MLKHGRLIMFENRFLKKKNAKSENKSHEKTLSEKTPEGK